MINYIPPQYPRHIPSLQPKMPQLIQSLMLNYMQQKYATGRQKEEQEFQMEESRKNRQFKRNELEADALLTEHKYFADQRKEGWVQVDKPNDVPEGYEQEDIVRGITTLKGKPTYWYKTRDKYPMEMYRKTAEGVIKGKAHSKSDRAILEKAGFSRGDFTTAKLPKYGDSKEEWEAMQKILARNRGVEAVRKHIHDTALAETGAELKPPTALKEFLAAKRQAYIDEHGKPPSAKQKALWMLEHKKASASQVTIEMRTAEEKRKEEIHGIKVGATVGEKRAALTTGKQDKAVYGAEGSQFNNMNKQNEVAYWDTSKWDNKTNIMKLSKEAIDLGWTPKEVQDKANISGMTVEQVLKEIGEL